MTRPAAHQPLPQPSAVPERGSRAAWICVALLCAFALVTRLTGRAWMLPHAAMGDERVWLGQMTLLRERPADAAADEGYGFYPQLVPRLALALAPDAPPRAGLDLPEHLAAAKRDLSLLRALSAALSALGVVGTWLLARHFARPWPAALAAGLVATSLLAAWYAPQARPHGAASALVPLGVWACTAVRRRGGAAAYLLAGAVLAVACSILQTCFLLLAPLVLAHALRARRGGRWAGLGLALALACVALGVRASYPFVFGAERGPGHALLGQTPLLLGSFNGTGWITLLGTYWRCDPLFLALFVAALALGVAALRGRAAPPARTWRARLAGHEDLAVALAFALPFAVVFSVYGLTRARYLLHLLPFAAVAVAVAAQAFWDAPRRSAASRRGLVALALGVLAAQAAACVRLASLRAAPSTHAEAAAWIAAHVDRGRAHTLLLGVFDLPLVRRGALEDRDAFARPWMVHQRRMPPEERARLGFDLVALTGPVLAEIARTPGGPVAWARERAADHVVVDVSEAEHRPAVGQIAEALDVRVLARFSPWRAGDGRRRPFLFRDEGLEYEAEVSWAWDVLCARALGPVIEVRGLSGS